MTVVEFLDRILPGMDAEVAKPFQRMLEKQGFKFQLGHKVIEGRNQQGGAKRRRSSRRRAATPQVLEADVVLVAIGRRPYHRGPRPRGGGRGDGSAAGSSSTTHFATNVPGIYAIGDVVARPDAGAQGRGRRRRGGRNPRRPGTAT